MHCGHKHWRLRQQLNLALRPSSRSSSNRPSCLTWRRKEAEEEEEEQEPQEELEKRNNKWRKKKEERRSRRSRSGEGEDAHTPVVDGKAHHMSHLHDSTLYQIWQLGTQTAARCRNFISAFVSRQSAAIMPLQSSSEAKRFAQMRLVQASVSLEPLPSRSALLCWGVAFAKEATSTRRNKKATTVPQNGANSVSQMSGDLNPEAG